MQNGLDLNSIKMDKDTYTDIRNNKEKYPKYIVAIAGILASYNSKWFAGYAKTHIGKSPSDKYIVTRNYYQESINNVLSQMSKLMNVKFVCGNYKTIKTSNAMIYCDPPYENTTGFKDKINHAEYWNWVRKVSTNNFVLCSEYQAPDDFIEIWSGEIRITLDHVNRSKSTEKLFAYKNGKYADYILKGDDNICSTKAVNQE